MAEQIRRRSERNWYWEEVEPKTRTIVGALGAADMSSIRKPSLEKKTASAAMEGFGVSLEYVSHTWNRSIKEFAEIFQLEYDPQAVPKAIIDGLREGDPEETRAVIAELGDCADRQGWGAELAYGATEQILASDDPYAAIPTLQALSTLAMYRLATTQFERGPVYVADPPAVPTQ